MRRRRGVVTMALAVAALSVVWRFLPPSTPPLYEGFCQPLPYRYLSPPPGITNNVTADAASKQLALDNGVQPTTELVTDEAAADGSSQAPQAQLIVNDSTFVIPPGTTAITLSITPVDPPPVLPTDGAIDGNVYNFSASINGKELVATSMPTIVLRPPADDSAPRSIEQFSGGIWKQVSGTTPIGCGNSYGAPVKGLGTFALIKNGVTPTPAPAPPAPSASSSPLVGIGLAAIAASVFGVVILLLRRRQARS